ncbi:response regulator [Pontibacter saemangeumensis]|uniref:Response regulator n=1 Tax=Pontibacter saemangeumensis TaxID=1084525 RepID=A0ABP8LM00_9BACT
MKIFIVDDDPISIFLTQRSFEMEGVEASIHPFLSAEEALEMLGKASLEDLPDIIFLDLNMPGVDGWEFLEAFEQLPDVSALEKCRTYILTSSLDTSDIAKANESPLVKGFIHKPIGPEDIQVILQAH